MQKKAIVFLTDGFEEAEALVTVDVLRRGGVDVITTSLTGSATVTGSHDITVTADALFDDAAIAYDAIILPGGPGTVNYYSHPRLPAYVKAAADNGALVAAICAAPGFIGSLGLLNGRRATCFPGFEDKLLGATVTGTPSETDGNIITGKSAGCVFDFALTVLAYLNGDEASDKVKASMYYNT